MIKRFLYSYTHTPQSFKKFVTDGIDFSSISGVSEDPWKKSLKPPPATFVGLVKISRPTRIFYPDPRSYFRILDPLNVSPYIFLVYVIRTREMWPREIYGTTLFAYSTLYNRVIREKARENTSKLCGSAAACVRERAKYNFDDEEERARARARPRSLLAQI